MKLSRRDFIHTGYAVAAVALVPDPVEAWVHGSAIQSFSQRNVVNVNFTFDNENPLIVANRFSNISPQLNGASPFDGFSLSPWPQQIDQDGYPNTTAASGQNVGGSTAMPSSSNFAGPWIISWDGDGRITQQSGTWTAANLFTAGTATMTIASPAVVSFANSFVAGQIVVFTTTGALLTGVLPNTPYYVLSSGLSGASFQISATRGGAAIVTSGSQSGTHTIQGFTQNANGSYTNFAGQKGYVIASNSGIASPTGVGYKIDSSGGAPATVNSISWSGGIVTVTMAAVHKRPVGSSLKLTLIGTDNANLNGTFLSTITTTTQFTFPLANPGAVTVFGTMVAFVSNVQIYRQADEADLLAGNIFRTAWKQFIVNLNPSALRFMNWSGGNVGNAYSFLDRTLPNHANWNCSAANYNWSIGPAYGRTSGYTNWTLAAVTTGTASNPNTTPASLLHGEIAVAQIGQNGTMGRGPQVTIQAITKASPASIQANGHGLTTGDKVWLTAITGMTQINGSATNEQAVTVIDANNFTIPVNSTGFGTFTAGYFTRYTGALTVTAITKANPGVVTVTNHGLTTGEVVYHSMSTGMVLLNLFPVTVTVIDANSYSIGVNTTGYPTFTSGSLQTYCTLDVGGRGAFPIIFNTGTPIATFTPASNNYIAQGNYKQFAFDKTVAGKTDGAGNYVMGAWIATNSTYGMSNDVPIEVCTACINEINALAVSQGVSKPIHMYYCTTPYGIDSSDPDQTSAKRYGQNAVNVILNGANGYSGLTAAAHLFVEYSNETWGDPVRQYIFYRGLSRWPTSGASNSVDMDMFRATGMAIDIGNAFPSQIGNSTNQRVHRVQGGPPNKGSAVNSVLYQYWFTGTSTPFYNTDTTVVSQGWGAPGTHHEALNFAPYFDAADSYYSTTTGTGTFTDDSAMYNGTDNSGNSGGNYSGAANPTQALTNLAAKIVTGGSGLGINERIAAMTDVSGWMTQGKFYINYEGGLDAVTNAGQSARGVHTLTANDQIFVLAFYNSSQWATAQINYFNSVAALPRTAMPAVYLISNNGGGLSGGQRWAYCSPDTYASGIEGQALLNNPTWVAMGARNQGLSS